MVQLGSLRLKCNKMIILFEYHRFDWLTASYTLITKVKTLRYTVDAGYKKTSYKNMPVIGTLPRFTESFVFYPIEFMPDIRTFHGGYKNMPDI